jgi:hypothetical protein
VNENMPNGNLTGSTGRGRPPGSIRNYGRNIPNGRNSNHRRNVRRRIVSETEEQEERPEMLLEEESERFLGGLLVYYLNCQRTPCESV